MDEDYTEEYLEAYNHGYEDCEQDFADKKIQNLDNLNILDEEELKIEYDKGIEEGFSIAKQHLHDLLEAYSRLEDVNPRKKDLINNQILTIKYSIDYLNAKVNDKPFYDIPWT
tara:strand:+ start:87 stop:425 length:339 start_codon:yes stop_codon:yes gene_type:complete